MLKKAKFINQTAPLSQPLDCGPMINQETRVLPQHFKSKIFTLQHANTTVYNTINITNRVKCLKNLFNKTFKFNKTNTKVNQCKAF